MNAPARPSRRSLLLATLATLPLAACGFQLRGVRDLPFATLYINSDRYSELTAQLRRAIEAQSRTKVTDEVTAAEAVLDITGNVFEKIILSLNSAGRVREYQLKQRFTFKVRTPTNVDIAPPSTIEVRRDLTYSDVDILAKQQEEQLLIAEMQSDVIQQLLRRLQAIKRNPA
ncbi:LPS-assembly lipoprotein LptE [Methyloversatilis thermotolerans]|uniref:LPS-assembly lipoprotein LptE n=1 Tax=Methyloversatilis thermotolerans TaxID=1346290 RepID=UPI0003A0CA59|nr:LPS assembly lipoprotein LptE [Methyloversatilis thermotolerans]